MLVVATGLFLQRSPPSLPLLCCSLCGNLGNNQSVVDSFLIALEQLQLGSNAAQELTSCLQAFPTDHASVSPELGAATSDFPIQRPLPPIMQLQ